MNRGILFAALAALVGSGLAQACRRAADPHQLATVDSLTNAVEAVFLTLNELDVHHYATADSILKAAKPLFMQRFADTLDRPTAALLGDQFIHLREARRMADDHLRIRTAAENTVLRLHQLHADMAQGALDREQGRAALYTEQRTITAMDPLVHQVITNYRATQRVLERQPSVDSILADTGTTHRTR